MGRHPAVLPHLAAVAHPSFPPTVIIAIAYVPRVLFPRTPQSAMAMQALKRLATRGASLRSMTIDESSTRWKERAGRDEGPDTYIAGERLCRRSIVDCFCASTRRRRFRTCR